MATFNKGLFGGFTGKLGNLVGYTVKGKQLVRTIGENTVPPTAAQLAVRQKMKIVTAALKPMLIFINVGFQFAIKNTSKNAFNEATSRNIKNATIGEYPDITIDYSKILTSAGNLMPAIDPQVNLLINGVEFTWQVDSDMDYDIKNDRAMLLIYFTEMQEIVYILSGEQRRNGRDFIELAPEYLNQKMETYISFLADNRENISYSSWAGRFN